MQLKTDLTTQNHWPMCKVIGTNSDDKGDLWNVKLLLWNSGNKDDKHILEWPITKIVLLLEVGDVDSTAMGALTYEQGAESLVGSQVNFELWYLTLFGHSLYMVIWYIPAYHWDFESSVK